MALIRKYLLGNLLEDLDVVFLRQGELPTDIYEDDNNVFVEMHVPGIVQDNLDITVEDDRLKVIGERSVTQETADRHYWVQEIRHGNFERVISLPCKIDKENVSAIVKDGVLKITLPKKKMGESKKVKINSK